MKAQFLIELSSCYSASESDRLTDEERAMVYTIGERINQSFVEIACVPTMDMKLCLTDFNKYFDLNNKETNFLSSDIYCKIEQIWIKPDHLQILLYPE